MSKFIKIRINRKAKIFENIDYIPRVVCLFERFSRYLCDDYFLAKGRSSLEVLIELIEGCGEYFWVVLDKKSNKFAGFVFFENLIGSGKILHSAEITTCFAPEFWGDFTKRAARRFIRYCFDKYGLQKLKALVFEQNFKVKMILKKSGFKKEAKLFGETLKNGKLQNIDIYSIIRKKEVTNEN